MNLIPGQIYKLTTKDWIPPVGRMIKGVVKTRKVLGEESIEHLHFYKVERQDGSTHRIEVETIADAQPVAAFN